MTKKTYATTQIMRESLESIGDDLPSPERKAFQEATKSLIQDMMDSFAYELFGLVSSNIPNMDSDELERYFVHPTTSKYHKELIEKELKKRDTPLYKVLNGDK